MNRIRRAADLIDDRLDAMNARVGRMNAGGAAPLYVGMPITAAEGNEFCRLLAERMAETIAVGGEPSEVIRGSLEHALCVGMMAALEPE